MLQLTFTTKTQKKAKHSVELLDNTPVDIDLLEQYDYSQLVKVISELPQIYKDIIYLYYLEELSAKDISKMLNISANTVWKRAERAKQLLRDALIRGELYE